MKAFVAIFVFACASALGDEKTDLFEREDFEALAKESPKIHRYRISVFRSFDPELVFDLDIWSDGTDGILVTKKARMVEEDLVLKNTKLVKNSTLRCNSQQILSFLRLLDKAEIWTLPEKDWSETTLIQDEPIADSILDGSVWTIEAIKDGKYRKLTRRGLNGVILSVPDEIIDQIGARRIYKEGILYSACIWLWVLGDESAEEIY